MLNTYEERRQDLLDIIRQSSSVHMGSWASNPGCINTLSDLHSCGNTACIGGHLAISPMFIANGGRFGFMNYPRIRNESHSRAVHTYLDTDPDATELVILGRGSKIDVTDWRKWRSKEAAQALELLYAYNYGELGYLRHRLSLLYIDNR